MKNLISISFVLLFLGTWLKPYMPLIEYSLNKNYISSVICENRSKPKSGCEGTCYLKKQLKESAEDEKSNSSPFSSSKQQKELVYDFLSITTMPENIEPKLNIPDIYLNIIIPVLFLDTPNQPPETFYC